MEAVQVRFDDKLETEDRERPVKDGGWFLNLNFMAVWIEGWRPISSSSNKKYSKKEKGVGKASV